MSRLSIAASLAWKVAAAEAAALRHPLIDRAHVLIGILSLEKALRVAHEDPEVSGALEGEHRRLDDLLAHFGLDAAALRRSLRDRRGRGTHVHSAGAAINRSDACKAAFERALELSGGREASCLHLLAALCETSDPHIDLLLRDAQVKPGDLRREALAFASEAEPAAAAPEEGAPTGRALDPQSFLREHLVGQDEAVSRIAERLRLAHARDRSRGPLAVFLLLGPAGVGKSETARLVAELLFGSASELHDFDMAACSEEEQVPRFVGEALTAALRSRPHSVVLLHELQRAHPRLFDVLARSLDLGRFSDASGHSADARDAIFVLTSSLRASVVRVMGSDGPGEASSAAALEEARRVFGADLLNRVDDVVVFRPLDEAAAATILRGRLRDLAESFRLRHGVSVLFTPEAERALAEAGFSPAYGARELERAVERLVSLPLLALAQSGHLARHAAWRVLLERGELYVVPAE